MSPLSILERREGMVNAVAFLTAATDHSACSPADGACTSVVDAYRDLLEPLTDRERFGVLCSLAELSLEAVVMGAERSGMASDTEMLQRLALTSAQRLERARAEVTR